MSKERIDAAIKAINMQTARTANALDKLYEHIHKLYAILGKFPKYDLKNSNLQ